MNFKKSTISKAIFFLIFICSFFLPFVAQSAKNPIRWSPASINETIVAGGTKDLTVTFTSSRKLKNADLLVEPELQPFVSVAPNHFDAIAANANYQVNVHFFVPSGSQTGLYQGTVYIKIGNKTYSDTLKVSLNIEAASTTTITTTTATTTTTTTTGTGTSTTTSTTTTTNTIPSGTAQLPKTGQTKCYDTYGTEISCAGTGQDGEIQAGVAWPNPRFSEQVFSSGYYSAVTDNLTGLMWTEDANAPGPSACGSGIYMTWQSALDYVKCLNNNNYLGYSDWHLPNINELESLINANEPNQATWLNTQGFSNVQADYYWSSSTYASFTSNAWVVYMSYGYVSHSGYKSSFYSYVWPVRAGLSGSLGNSVISIPKTGQTKCYDTNGNEISCAGTGQDGEIQAGVAWPNPRFSEQVFSSGYYSAVTDNLTGLMWTEDANAPGPSACGSGTYMTWQAALDYVKCLNSNSYLGYSDWRLSNRKELTSLVDYSNYSPALPTGHPFINVQSYLYSSWSSSTNVYITSSAWFVYMWIGDVDYNGKDYHDIVWPVRGGYDETTTTTSTTTTTTEETTTTSTTTTTNTTTTTTT